MLADKVYVKVPLKYSDYVDVLLLNLTMELPENTDINKYTIKLVEVNQLFYELIYTLDSVELEILKAYIEIHIKTKFIQLFKSLVGAPKISQTQLKAVC